MPKPTTKYHVITDEPEQDEIPAWTAEQAQAWRQANPSPSLWMYWRVQVVVGVALVVIALGLQVWQGWTWAVSLSALYGVLVVLGPSALAVAGVLRGWEKRTQLLGNRGGAGLGFATVLLWEGCKVLITIGLLALAPVLLGNVMSWPAMVLCFIITLKAYWWAWMRSSLRARP